MKRVSALIITFLLVCTVFLSCAGKDLDALKSGSLSLDDLKKAASDAGYLVTDDHMSAFLEDVKGGFTVNIVADNTDTIYSVIECGSEESVAKNTKTINDAGYNIAISNGIFMSFYGVDVKDGVSKDILASILEGKPIKPPKASE